MTADLQKFKLETRPDDIIDITNRIQYCLDKSPISDGIVNIFMPGSTGAISTVEYEPGLVKTDIPEFLHKILPEGVEYAHHKTWGDHNGAGHMRSFLLKPSFTVPVVESKLLLGTWQQIIYLELDEKPRTRTIYCQIVG